MSQSHNGSYYKTYVRKTQMRTVLNRIQKSHLSIRFLI